jgi:pimeloyl-ACP methyl ester carboxylesterase
MRGHGNSSKPDHGYRISRLAADLRVAMDVLDLKDATIVAHSMGCAVVWSYLELFGNARIGRLVLVDQGAAIVAQPDWGEHEKLVAGAILSADQVIGMLAALDGPNGESVTIDLLRSMTTKELPTDRFDWLLAQNLLMSRTHAARLFFDHAFKDWSDVIGRISVPTLVVGARASIVPWQAIVAMGEKIAGSRTFVFDEAERGSHFAFLENSLGFLRLTDLFFSSDVPAAAN